MLLAKGPQIVEATAGGPLRTVKPFTPEVRAEIDYELTNKSIDFIKRQKAAGKPFFLYLPFSMGHVPNLPATTFAGKSRIGNYGDKLMEGDFHFGKVLHPWFRSCQVYWVAFAANVPSVQRPLTGT